MRARAKNKSGAQKAKRAPNHKKGSLGNYKATPKSEVRDLRAPEPNFHGAYCEFMLRDGMVFLHGPMSAEGPQYVLCSSPEELWAALKTLAAEPGALNPAGRMPRGTEALDWSAAQMKGLVATYNMKKENAVIHCDDGPGLRKKPARKMTLEELGLG